MPQFNTFEEVERFVYQTESTAQVLNDFADQPITPTLVYDIKSRLQHLADGWSYIGIIPRIEIEYPAPRLDGQPTDYHQFSFRILDRLRQSQPHWEVLTVDDLTYNSSPRGLDFPHPIDTIPTMREDLAALESAMTVTERETIRGNPPASTIRGRSPNVAIRDEVEQYLRTVVQRGGIYNYIFEGNDVQIDPMPAVENITLTPRRDPFLQEIVDRANRERNQT